MALAAVRRVGDRKEAPRSTTDAGGCGADYERIARPRPSGGGSPKNREKEFEPKRDYLALIGYGL